MFFLLYFSLRLAGTNYMNKDFRPLSVGNKGPNEADSVSVSTRGTLVCRKRLADNSLIDQVATTQEPAHAVRIKMCFGGVGGVFFLFFEM